MTWKGEGVGGGKEEETVGKEGRDKEEGNEWGEKEMEGIGGDHMRLRESEGEEGRKLGEKRERKRE